MMESNLYPATLPPKGVWVPVPTFFTSSGSLDIAAQVQHAQHLATSGITGLVLIGSTGESAHLTTSERNTLIAGVRAALPKPYPLMAGTHVHSIPEVLSQLKEAAAAGADYGLVLAPGYFSGQGTTQRGLAEWFEAVADESKIPVLVYHYPGVSNGLVLEAVTMQRLRGHKNIVGCKMSHGNVSALSQVALRGKREWRVFSGQGQMLLPVMMCGGAGVIDGLAAVFPRVVVRLYAVATTLPLTEEGLEEARRLQWLVSSACEYVCVRWAVVGIKEAVRRVLGIGSVEGGRLPIRGSVEGMGGDWGVVEEVFRELGEVEAELKEKAKK